MKKGIKIFISSSEKELEYERETTFEVISSMNMDPVLFELYPALSNSPFQVLYQSLAWSST